MVRNRAFTMVEMLVTIAVVLILLNILLPVISDIREAARRALCSANLHQTGLANMQWALDHDDKFVEGQPSYDKGHDAHPNDPGNIGQYAVWDREWRHPSQAETYGGPYLKHGALVRKQYLPSGRNLYCPSWTVPWLQYEVSGKAWGNIGGGWFEDESRIPRVQTLIATSYHYNSMFGSDDYRTVSKWRGPMLNVDPSDSAVMADAFADPPKRGVDQHHKDGYNVLYLGGDVKYYHDPGLLIRNLYHHGDPYFAGKSMYRNFQSMAWRMFEGRS